MATLSPYNPEQSAESEPSKNSFEIEPEIYGQKTFSFDEKLDILSTAEQLASEATYLINILQTTQSSDIREQFQIELRKIDLHDGRCFTYKMSLRIDPVLWFRHHAFNSSDERNLERLYEIGSRYVSKVKSETEHYPKVENENEIQRIPIDKSIFTSWCKTDQKGTDCPKQMASSSSCTFDHYNCCPGENYGLKGECDTIAVATTHNSKYIHFSKIDTQKAHVYYRCRFPSISLNRQKVLCLFMADQNFWIYNNKVTKASCFPYFIVAARSSAIPVITLNPVKHCLNEQYVQTSDAWQAVLQTLIYMKNKIKLDHLPLNRIYINFGKWMQQKADDPMYRNCHAHINIVLSRETMDKIDQSYKSNDKSINVKKWFPSLVGSVIPPKSHRLDDSWELINYMNDHMIPLLFQQNRELKRTISILKDQVEKIEQENERLRRTMFSKAQEGQEPDDLPYSVDASGHGTEINDKACALEFTPTHND